MTSIRLRNYILFAAFGFIAGVLAERHRHATNDTETVEIHNSFNVIVVKPEDEP